MIRRCSFQANSDRCLILRQQFAIKLLDIMSKDALIISQDETFLSISDHRRMCWRERGKSTSVSTKSVAPRISILGAIDTNGSAYISLSQSNTNNLTKTLFLKHFFKILDQERPFWRDNSYLVIDGASYN
jgi:hypothetical protein